jgi:hypothetical protein
MLIPIRDRRVTSSPAFFISASVNDVADCGDVLLDEGGPRDVLLDEGGPRDVLLDEGGPRDVLLDEGGTSNVGLPTRGCMTRGLRIATLTRGLCVDPPTCCACCH